MKQIPFLEQRRINQFTTEAMKQICFDSCSHTCETCDQRTEDGCRDQMDCGLPDCPAWVISADMFTRALEEWMERNPGRNPAEGYQCSDKEPDRYVNEGTRQICEDFFIKNCDSCEFRAGNGYVHHEHVDRWWCAGNCPENQGKQCPRWGIDFDHFMKAQDVWQHLHPDFNLMFRDLSEWVPELADQPEGGSCSRSSP